ncbi:MAG: hypothetical protein ABJA89_14250, partial [Lapillicoccus sp.]
MAAPDSIARPMDSRSPKKDATPDPNAPPTVVVKGVSAGRPVRSSSSHAATIQFSSHTTPADQ